MDSGNIGIGTPGANPDNVVVLVNVNHIYGTTILLLLTENSKKTN
jgi:hypothetical protein